MAPLAILAPKVPGSVTANAGEGERRKQRRTSSKFIHDDVHRAAVPACNFLPAGQECVVVLMTRQCICPRGTDMAESADEKEQRIVRELPWLTEVDYPFGLVTANGELMVVLEVIDTYLCVTGDLFIEIALMEDDDEYDFSDAFPGKIVESIETTLVNVSQIQRIIKSLEEFKTM